jgi:heme-degrading monooxygenase HmoA
MWVRIQEVSFPVDRTDEIVARFRETAVARHGGDGYLGFRLLLDGADGRALEVSYWATEAALRAVDASGVVSATDPSLAVTKQTNYYELAIDAA